RVCQTCMSPVTLYLRLVCIHLSFFSPSFTSAFSFLNCFAAHRDLHSFPTRRSSDLEMVPVELRGDVLAPVGRRLTPGQRQQAASDRKSTRLNSSHVSISYAVFCLKKKIRITHK